MSSQFGLSVKLSLQSREYFELLDTKSIIKASTTSTTKESRGGHLHSFFDISSTREESQHNLSRCRHRIAGFLTVGKTEVPKRPCAFGCLQRHRDNNCLFSSCALIHR